jgi:uncharacterized DUF497 family protein
MRIEFDWDPAKAASNRAKHGITFEEAMTVFRDPLAVSILDTEISEERWITLGMMSTGNLAVVVHTWVEPNPLVAAVRVISARSPTRHEARQYREKPMP